MTSYNTRAVASHKSGAYVFKHDVIFKNMHVRGDFRVGANPHGTPEIRWLDLLTMKDGVVPIANHSFALSVVDAIHDRRWDYVRVWSSAKNTTEVNNLWVSEWKKKRCMHKGMPNKAATLLLTGLRKRVGISFNPGRTGEPVRDKTSSRLIKCGLVDMLDPIPKKVRAGVMTNIRGLEVLDHWAATKGSFAPFLHAYFPPKFRQEFISSRVFEEMLGHER